MTEHASKRGTSGTKPLWLSFKGKRRQLALHAPQREVADIAAMRFEISSEKLHALRDRTDANLTFMERKVKLLIKKPPHLWNDAAKPLTAATDHIEVIYVPTIMPTSERPLHVIVEPSKIDVAKELAGEIADRKSATHWTEEEAFVMWQRVPIGKMSFDAAVLSGIEQHDFAGQIVQEVHIEALAPRLPVYNAM